jgi:hypothetical protein
LLAKKTLPLGIASRLGPIGHDAPTDEIYHLLIPIPTVKHQSISVVRAIIDGKLSEPPVCWFMIIPVLASAFSILRPFSWKHVASATLVFPSGNGCEMLARIRLKVLVERLALQG